ncbi:hypothetical protein BASA60_011571 [Batrachochytrium salamandrivorans]|nr:hypothetical protein BASA60_011571 [Batrachochytrium salamandrivorans]
MVPLLDMIPTKLSEKLSETRIDAVIFFLQQFEPDVQSRNVKFASAVLGLCNAFKSTALMPHQFQNAQDIGIYYHHIFTTQAGFYYFAA